jgi:hypothetical protein
MLLVVVLLAAKVLTALLPLLVLQAQVVAAVPL